MEPLCSLSRTSLTLAHLSGPPQLQKNKEQEEQLGEMIQAYEKLCVEKNDLETELGEMVRLREWGLRYSCTWYCVILYEPHVPHTPCLCA